MRGQRRSASYLWSLPRSARKLDQVQQVSGRRAWPPWWAMHEVWLNGRKLDRMLRLQRERIFLAPLRGLQSVRTMFIVDSASVDDGVQGPRTADRGWRNLTGVPQETVLAVTLCNTWFMLTTFFHDDLARLVFRKLFNEYLSSYEYGGATRFFDTDGTSTAGIILQLQPGPINAFSIWCRLYWLNFKFAVMRVNSLRLVCTVSHVYYSYFIAFWSFQSCQHCPFGIDSVGSRDQKQSNLGVSTGTAISQYHCRQLCSERTPLLLDPKLNSTS